MIKFKKKIWEDQRGRIHNQEGKFIPRPKELSLESDPLYFSQDENKPQTYNRTGRYIEVSRDPEEVCGWLLGLLLGGYFLYEEIFVKHFDILWAFFR